MRDLESEIKASRLPPIDGSVVIEGQIKDSPRTDMNLLENKDVEVFVCAADVESGVLAGNRSSIKSDIVGFPSNSSSTVIPIGNESEEMEKRMKKRAKMNFIFGKEE